MRPFERASYLWHKHRVGSGLWAVVHAHGIMFRRAAEWDQEVASGEKVELGFTFLPQRGAYGNGVLYLEPKGRPGHWLPASTPAGLELMRRERAADAGTAWRLTLEHESGSPYYVNLATKETAWEKPLSWLRGLQTRAKQLKAWKLSVQELHHDPREAESSSDYEADVEAAERFYDRGLDEAAQGREKAALDCYREALKQDPTHGKSLYRLGMAAMERGELEEAHRELKQALATKELSLAQTEAAQEAMRVTPVSRLYDAAVGAEGRGQLEVAQGMYREVLVLEPCHACALYRLGMMLMPKPAHVAKMDQSRGGVLGIRLTLDGDCEAWGKEEVQSLHSKVVGQILPHDDPTRLVMVRCASNLDVVPIEWELETKDQQEREAVARAAHSLRGTRVGAYPCLKVECRQGNTLCTQPCRINTPLCRG